ncbi:uncharacterized protein LOC106883299 isoform X2 [Octopus bimaculoides]|nr:uncharacterized protein LOC106883299 isoform X2 [Octopus bimaculoides]XP_052833959.1 uncharacterized protein LOC106883299 isoform X2 [Octopus bimaculoides]
MMAVWYLLCSLSAIFCLTSANTYKITQSGNVVLNGNVTLMITIPNMRRPVVWRCHNYKYECDRTCANGTNYKVTQSGNHSTLWIRNVTKECLTWRFDDDNLQGGTIHLKINNGGTSSLRTSFIFVIGIIIAVII